MLHRQVIRLLWLPFVCCVGISAASAQEPVCPPTPQSDAQTLKRLSRTIRPDRGVLWKVSRDGRRSFLYATVHVAKLPWLFPGPLVTKALMASSALAVEVDTTAPSLAARMTASENHVAQSAIDPEATPPRMAALTERIDDQLKLACIPKARFAGATLGAMATSLELLSARDQGLYPDYGIDASLIGFEKATSKKIIELEVPGEQAQALGVGGIRSVENSIARLESGESRAQLIKLTEAWGAGDFAALERYSAWCNCAKEELGNLVDKRNVVLAERIANLYATQDGVFAAVGVLHTIGAGGVVERLRRMGYSVEQVPVGDKAPTDDSSKSSL